MQNYIQHLKLAAKRFAWILILYSVCRLFFHLLNTEYFSDGSFSSIVTAYITGIRFDIAAIIFTNFIFIVLLLPGSWKNNITLQKTAAIVFFAINALALLLNFIDARFFDFINKRSTSAFFTLMSSNSDVWAVLPRIIRDYWYVAAICILFLIIFWKGMPRLKQPATERLTIKYFILQTGIFILVTGLMLLGARGTKLKPISITDAASGTGPKYIPLVLNTTFSILKTIENENLQELSWFPQDSLTLIYNPVHSCRTNHSFRKMNVVIFILESFSKEYCEYLGGIGGFTPNLDSLLEESLVFPNAFANGTQSYEAMPAIIAGIPSLMDRPYSGSNYTQNSIESLPELLRRQGYFTSFFHGGNNGTMGFSNFARIAGIEKYLGRDEYNNDADYDGYWGIWDEPYLKYFAGEISRFPQPFFSAVFTLSSHHPYNIPEKYKDRFKDSTLPILKSIGYADFALGEFFRTAVLMPWFENTLFIFTADHAAQALQSTYNSPAGMLAIPLAFYRSGDPMLKGIDSTVCQQIDIMPTVLDYLQYPENFFAFGESVIDKKLPHRCISYVNGIYQLIEGNYILQFDGEKVISFGSLSGNLINSGNPEMIRISADMEKTIRAIIQTYNYCLIHNRTALNIKNGDPAKFLSKSDKIN